MRSDWVRCPQSGVEGEPVCCVRQVRFHKKNTAKMEEKLKQMADKKGL